MINIVRNSYFTICALLFFSCNSINTLNYKEIGNDANLLTIHEGIVCTEAERIKYTSNDGNNVIITLSKPLKIAQAVQEEAWGFFQFPSMGKADDGTLIISWQMKEDSHISYGKNSVRDFKPMISKDGGRSWKEEDRNYFYLTGGYNVRLSNGDIIQTYTPTAKPIATYRQFPKAIGNRKGYSFYKMNELPDELQGIYLNYYYHNNNKSELIHAKIHDNGLLRYAINGFMPVVWWGNIKELADGSIVAGCHPCFYLGKEGEVSPSGVTFYQSTDKGLTWNAISKIPFLKNGHPKYYEEPAFEILSDSTFICIVRTGAVSPMYRSFSSDKGMSWSVPEPFAPNGVKPRLLKLKNGILVLVSGRPGVQIRFCLDGLGRKWTIPIDMISFMKGNGTYTRDVSCGYVSIVEADDDSFYVAYSDFTTKNERGEIRKSIWFRKIKVTKNGGNSIRQ